MPLAWLVALLPVAAVPPDTAVVCPVEFRAALEPWVKYRTAQGHTLAFVSSNTSAGEIRDEIRAVAKGGKLKFIVLVGDADPAADRNAALRARSVPTHLAPAKVTVRWGSEPQIASDNWYADLDDDHLPDAAIGRLTPDTPAELARIVAKILRYEQNPDFGLWRRRVSFIAGLGGFGRLADATLETAAKKFITEGIPAGYASHMTYGSWTSPYCPDPRQFRQSTLDRLNEGCMFWVYIGHGQSRHVDAVHVPGANYPIFGERDMLELRSTSPAIACFLACYTAAFDQKEDCLAEQMLRTPGAPVAIVGGSRVTMPYAMSVLGTELLQQCFAERRATLGEALMVAKRNTMQPLRKSDNRQLLDQLASLISPAPAELDAERAEHLDLFNLIGDPLLSLHQPQAIELESPAAAAAGQTIRVAGTCPVDGRCTVELVVRRDRLRFAAPQRSQYDPSAVALAAYTDVYGRANDPRLDQAELETQAGHFATELRIPKEAHGACHVRVYIEGQHDFALGSADVAIARQSLKSKTSSKDNR